MKVHLKLPFYNKARLWRATTIALSVWILGYSSPAIAKSKRVKVIVLAKKVDRAWEQEKRSLAEMIHLPLKANLKSKRPKNIFVFKNNVQKAPLQRTASRRSIKVKSAAQTPVATHQRTVQRNKIKVEYVLNKPTARTPSENHKFVVPKETTDAPNDFPKINFLSSNASDMYNPRFESKNYAQDLVSAVNSTGSISNMNSLDDRIISTANNLTADSSHELFEEQTYSKDHSSQRTLYRSHEGTKYTNLELVVVDERSNFNENQIFPISAVEIKIIGSDLVAKTDNQGKTLIRNLPKDASYLISVQDPEGRVLQTLKEVDLVEAGSQKTYIKVSRIHAFENHAQSADVVQDYERSSLCAVIEEDLQRASDVQVSLNVQANGPYYFTSIGLIDPRLGQTQSNGYFCFFNVPAGLHVLSFISKNAQIVKESPIFLAQGTHTEEVYDLTSNINLRTMTAASASAHHHIQDGDADVASQLNPVSYAEMIQLGQSKPLQKYADAILKNDQDQFSLTKNIRLYANGAGFEPAIYQLPTMSSNRVISLLPRGYASDLALEKGVVMDSQLGRLLVEQGESPEQANNSDIFVFDEYGQEVLEDSFDLGNRTVTRRFHANLQPGRYTVLVKAPNGDWLDSKIAYIYEETLSVINTGRQLLYK